MRKIAKESGAFDAVICNHWAKGGAGATDLADAVVRAAQAESNFKFLYDLNVSIQVHIRILLVDSLYTQIHTVNVRNMLHVVSTNSQRCG